MKDIKSLIVPLCLSTAVALVSACDNREDVLSDWDPDYVNKCASFGAEAEFDQRNDAYYRAENIRDYLQNSRVGAVTDQHMVETDAAFCFGDTGTPHSDVIIHGKTPAYIINENISDEQAALVIMKAKIGKNARQLADKSSKLVPEDALLWARMTDAHKAVAGLEQLYYTADRDFHSTMWNTVRADDQYGASAQTFEAEYQQSYDLGNALFAAFGQAMDERVVDEGRDHSFLSWYWNELQDRTVPTAEPCMTFTMDGPELSICPGTKTVPPEEGTAQYILEEDSVVSLGNRLFDNEEDGFSYFDHSSAEATVQDDGYRMIPDSLIADFAKIKQKAGNLGSGSRGFGFGISVGGRLGITF